MDPRKFKPMMSQYEHEFRCEHLGHELSLKENNESGIGFSTYIACLTCKTEFQDVTDVEIW